MTSLSILEIGLLSPVGGLAELARVCAQGAGPEAAAILPQFITASGPEFRRTPRLARLALTALTPLAPRPGDPGQALVLATAHGSTAATFEFLDSVLRDGPALASPTAFAHSVTNMAAALVGRHLGLTGPALTVTNALLTPALETAASLLVAGMAETVFLGAVAEISPLMDEVERRVGRIVSIPVEGAVFFRLGLAEGSSQGPRLVNAREAEAAEAASGLWPAFGQGPLASAFRLALAFWRFKEPGLAGFGFPGEDFRLEGNDDQP